MRLLDEPSDERAWFAPCYVRVPKSLSGFGPVGYRDGATLRFPSYGDSFREPFHTWLWSDEVQVARRIGYQIIVTGYGWEWEASDTDNTGYLTELWRLREATQDKEMLDWIKKCGVASIGRQAIPPLSYSIVDDASPLHTEDDLPLIGGMDAPISGYWLHADPEADSTPRVTHWWAYSLMKCRLALWERMEQERIAGNTVIMSNYDGILLSEPSKGLVRDKPDYGEWKQTRHTRVFIPYPRALVSAETTVLPGVSGEERGRYAY